MSGTLAASDSAGAALPPPIAAELQEHLKLACDDLERLQSLLTHACDTLLGCFHDAHGEARTLQEALASSAALERLDGRLRDAVTALQFQDLASQLVAHTQRHLALCADRLDTPGDDTVFGERRAAPVAQGGVDAGSIELF